MKEDSSDAAQEPWLGKENVGPSSPTVPVPREAHGKRRALRQLQDSWASPQVSPSCGEKWLSGLHEEVEKTQASPGRKEVVEVVESEIAHLDERPARRNRWAADVEFRLEFFSESESEKTVEDFLGRPWKVMPKRLILDLDEVSTSASSLALEALDKDKGDRAEGGLAEDKGRERWEAKLEAPTQADSQSLSSAERLDEAAERPEKQVERELAPAVREVEAKGDEDAHSDSSWPTPPGSPRYMSKALATASPTADAELCRVEESFENPEPSEEPSPVGLSRANAHSAPRAAPFSECLAPAERQLPPSPEPPKSAEAEGSPVPSSAEEASLILPVPLSPEKASPATASLEKASPAITSTEIASPAITSQQKASVAIRSPKEATLAMKSPEKVSPAMKSPEKTSPAISSLEIASPAGSRESKESPGLQRPTLASPPRGRESFVEFSFAALARSVVSEASPSVFGESSLEGGESMSSADSLPFPLEPRRPRTALSRGGRSGPLPVLRGPQATPMRSISLVKEPRMPVPEGTCRQGPKKLGTFERSQLWMEQRELRLEQLREKQLKMARGELAEQPKKAAKRTTSCAERKPCVAQVPRAVQSVEKTRLTPSIERGRAMPSHVGLLLAAQASRSPVRHDRGMAPWNPFDEESAHSTKSSCNGHQNVKDASRSPRAEERSRPSSRSLSPRGPASLYARGEAWLERKRSRERDLREEAQRHEVSECTFQPQTLASASSFASLSGSAFNPSAVRAMTPERARQLFERQQIWRQRLDDESDRRRQEQRAEAEREICLCRRAASAGPAFRRGREEEIVDADKAFANFHERNRRWQREREARWEQLHDEVQRSRTRPSPRASSRPRSASETPRSKPGLADVGLAAAPCPAQGKAPQEEAAEQPLPCHVTLVPAPPPEGAQGARLQAPHAAPGQPVRALPVPSLTALVDDGFGIQSSDGERQEVFSHLQALRQCMVASKGRSQDVPSWQRALQVEGARLSGAGAAPLRPGPEPVLRQRGRSCDNSHQATPRTSRSPVRSSGPSRRASPSERQQSYRKRPAVISVDVS